MTPFGLVIVAVIVTLFVVALATPAGRVALIGRARGMVLMLVVPFLFFPFSKTLFLAFDLTFRPATPDELARHRTQGAS